MTWASMIGNVWEWCEDYTNPERSPDAVVDPAGPPNGLERVIRGGSFVSTTSQWVREFRSSMDPESRSRFTGIRVVRSTAEKSGVAMQQPDDSWFSRYNQPPKGFERSVGLLQPLLPNGGAGAWNARADEIRAKWKRLLGEPDSGTKTVTVRPVNEASPQNFSGTLYQLEMEPGIWEKVYVLRPRSPAVHPRPVVIVPYYD